jgi:hypothetical protein
MCEIGLSLIAMGLQCCDIISVVAEFMVGCLQWPLMRRQYCDFIRVVADLYRDKSTPPSTKHPTR